MAEDEIVADHDMGDLEPLAQHLDDEGLGALARQLAVEMQHEEMVEADRLELAHLDAKGRQAEGRRVGREEFARVRLEGHHRVAGPELAGMARRGGDHRVVATMDAVEIADRDYRAAGLDRHLVVVTKQSHGAVTAVRPPFAAADRAANITRVGGPG